MLSDDEIREQHPEFKGNIEHLRVLLEGEGAKSWNGWRLENPDEKPNLRGAHLAKANLVAAHLENTFLWEAHLENAEMFVAHLEKANLGEAHLEKANLRSAHLGIAPVFRTPQKTS